MLKATHQTDTGSDLCGKERTRAGDQRFQPIGNNLLFKKENVLMKYIYNFKIKIKMIALSKLKIGFNWNSGFSGDLMKLVNSVTLALSRALSEPQLFHL